jgi:glycosyltransferase involved in cell wall biosynthesis
MRVGFLSRCFEHHGRHSGYHMLAQKWLGDKTVYFLPDNSALPRSAALRSIASALLGVRRRFAKRNVRRRALEDDIDVLHVLYGESDLPFPELSVGRKLVASIHQPVSHLSRSPGRLEFLKRQLRDVDLTIALSREQKSFLQELLPGKRVELVPHGVDTDFFRSTGEPRDRTILVSCGWYRDMEFARGVIRELAERDTALRIKAFGGGASELTSASSRLEVLTDLSDEELRREFCTCTLMFLPLKETVANNALLEAMSCDTVVVAPALPAVTEYLGGADTCYQPGLPPKGVAEFMRQLLERPIHKLALRARAVAFGWQPIALRMKELLSTLCE